MREFLHKLGPPQAVLSLEIAAQSLRLKDLDVSLFLSSNPSLLDIVDELVLPFIHIVTC